MKKRNDKIFILLLVIVIFFVMSWIVEGGMYNAGSFVSTGFKRIGLFDIVAVFHTAVMNKLTDIFYILAVGGSYGVLSQTKSYRKLVYKVASFIKGKEAIAMAIITLLMGAYTSIGSQILVLFCITPFIISVFLRTGQDRVTALNAGFGGMFIGFLGLTFGTYGVNYLNDATGLGIEEMLFTKIILFIIAYVLYNVFAILYMKKHKDSDGIKYDMFCPEELDETKVKKRKRTKIWPIIVFGIVSLITIMLGFISWVASFDVKFFDEFFTSMTSIKIGNISIFGDLLGSYLPAFGNWTFLIYGSFVMLVFTIIMAIIDKMNVDLFIKNFGMGVKKISKVAFIYVFAFTIACLANAYPWQNTIINSLFGDGTFNVFSVFIIVFISTILVGDPDILTAMFGTFIAASFVDNLAVSGLIWRVSSALALVIGPTSFLLLTALTYVDLPYVRWFKYVWKFVLSFAVVVLIMLSLMLYV